MWNVWKVALRRKALSVALSRPAPNRIPMSHDLDSRDYYMAHLGDATDARRFLVLGMMQQGVSGLWFNEGKRDAVEAVIDNDHLAEFSVDITYFLREAGFRYSSPLMLLIHRALFIPSLRLRWQRLLQLLFNTRRLERSDRSDLLRLILEQKLAEPDYCPEPFTVMKQLYGVRWHSHPEGMHMLGYYRALLESLAHTEDLRLVDSHYEVLPKAFVTLSAQEEADRKHRDAMRQQSTLGWLTFLLAAIGILQAAVTWFGAPR